eukprot:COSAG03_NODE_15823_length_419_cov_1.100000_1_plen_75_part_00
MVASCKLGELYRVQNNLAAAEPLLALFVKGFDDPVSACVLGQLYVRQKRFDLAAPLLEFLVRCVRAARGMSPYE